MKQQVSEEECWFVIGAHQAGASERQCSELSGLSKTITHNIIRNFKKLGSPHASKLSVEDLLKKRDSVVEITATKRKSEDISNTPRKRGRPRNPVEPPFFTQSIVQEALADARDDQKTVYSNNTIQVYPLDRLHTPPSDEDQQQTESLKIEEARDCDLPLTPRLDEEEEEEEEDLWTMKDDEVLLLHVLGLPLKHVKWKEVESQFEDRHLAKMCADRWEFLKKQLVKDIKLVTNKKDDDDFVS